MLAFNPIIISNYDSDTEETVRPLGVQAPNTEKEVIVEPAKESEPSKEETDGEDEEEPEEDLKEETVPEEPTPVQPSTLGKRTCFSGCFTLVLLRCLSPQKGGFDEINEIFQGMFAALVLHVDFNFT